MKILNLSAVFLFAASAFAGSDVPVAGFAMRFDDNHTPVQWREVAAIFEAEGLRCSFAVTSSWLSPEQGKCLKELSERGHEIMDHTPQHAMYMMTFPTVEGFAAHAERPYVAEANAATRTLYCRPEIDWTRPDVLRFRASVRGDRLESADSAAMARLTFSRKLRNVRTGRLYGICTRDPEPKRLCDFWRRPVNENIDETEWESVDQSAIRVPLALRHDQALLTRTVFDRYGLPRPTMWIQPGGWEAFLDGKSLQETYGRDFGYVGGDACVGASPLMGCVNDCDPLDGRWTFRANFAYFDEGKDLAQVKRLVADSVAKNRSFIYISHMSANRLPGKWAEWIDDTKAFAKWLKASDIPCRTLSELTRETFDRPRTVPNALPALTVDRDGDGRPDGWSLGAGTTVDLKTGVASLRAKGGLSLDGLAGLTRGPCEVRFRVRGRKGDRLGFALIPRGVNGKTLNDKAVCGDFCLEKDGETVLAKSGSLVDTARAADVFISSVTGIELLAAELSPPEKLSFTGHTNKDPLLYSCGEEMRFSVMLVDKANGNAAVKGRRLVWTRRGDDGKTESGEATSDAPLLVKTTIGKPGFVRLTVNVLDAAGKKARDAAENRDVAWDGGAGADVNRIEAWPAPADFDAFWDAKVAALGKVPCAATLTELASRSDRAFFAKFLVPMPGEEMPAQGLVAWPKEAKDGSLPLDVAVTGYGFHKTVFDERAALAGKGRICISITRQGEDPWREEAYYKDIQTNVCKNFCFRNTDRRPEDTDHFKMLMRDALAVRWAKTLPQWDGRNLKTHGGSMGGYQALGLAALDRQVSEVDAEVPWCADFAGATKLGRMGGWTPGWTKALDYLSLARLATRVTCPVRMRIGLGDYICPPSGEMLLFNALKGRKSLVANQNRGHGGAYGPAAPSYAFENRIAVLPDLPRRMSVALDGKDVRVEEARCSKFPLNQVWPGFQRPMDQTEIDYFVNVDLTKPGTLTVTVPGLKGAEVLMRPMSEAARCAVAGDVVTVAVPKPEHFTLEFGPRGKAKRFPTLHVFVNPPFAYAHVKDEIYFGPGEHHVGLVQPKSGQTVCLAPGAVVYGSLFLCGVKDVRVVGRGIFDGSLVERCDPGSKVYQAAIAHGIGQATTADTVCNSFTAYAVTNVFVEGVTFRDSGSWTVKIRAGSRDVTLDNVKIVGMWRYNTDGINMCASENVTVRNSFVRSYDDCFIARGAQIFGDNSQPTRNLLVENCTMWCDWGKCFEVWAGRDPCLIEHVRFRNNRILSMAALACDVTTWYGSRSNVIRDVVFEDLEIDLPPPRYGQEILTKSFSSEFQGRPYSSDRIITVDCDRLGDMVAEQTTGAVSDYSKYSLAYSDIVLRNVKLYGQPKGTRTTAKVATKFPCHTIENVTFENVPEMEIEAGGELKNFTVNGKKVK